MAHFTYRHRNEITELNSVGINWLTLANQCFNAEDSRQRKITADNRRHAAKKKELIRLADMVRHPRKSMIETEDSVDTMTTDQLRERCKLLKATNTQLLRESVQINKKKSSTIIKIEQSQPQQEQEWVTLTYSVNILESDIEINDIDNYKVMPIYYGH